MLGPSRSLWEVDRDVPAATVLEQVDALLAATGGTYARAAGRYLPIAVADLASNRWSPPPRRC